MMWQLLAILFLAFMVRHWKYIREDVYDLICAIIVTIWFNFPLILFAIIVIISFVYMWVSLP